VRRRDFFAVAGSGLFVFFKADLDAFQERASFPAARPVPPTSTPTCTSAPMPGHLFCRQDRNGQGNMTALAQLLAEELDVPFDSVDMVMATPTAALTTWARSAPCPFAW